MAPTDDVAVVAEPVAESAPAEVGEGKVKPKKAKASKPRKFKSASAHPPYYEMISDAITTLKERTGSSQYAITKFAEDKHKDHLPPTFKKLLLHQLKKFVAAGKLVKIKNSYKLPASRPAPPKPAPAKAKKPAAAAPKPKPKPKPKTVAKKAKPAAAAAAKPKPKTVTKAKPAAKSSKPATRSKAAPKPSTRPAKSAKTSAKAAPAKKPAAPKKSAAVKKLKSAKTPAKKPAARKAKKAGK